MANSRSLRLRLLLLLFLTQSDVALAASFTQEELAFMPASTQIELFKNGIISPVDVLNAQINLFNKTNKEVNAATKTFFSAALQQAKIAESRYRMGNYRALEGITVGLKDEHYDKGWPVSQGSLLHKNDPVKEEADPITQKLKDAGAILVMQTTVPEFYLTFATHSKAWGVTRNPWNLAYSVGGSSGGSGAALAAGYVTLATGSDMGGSIRIPSSLCGLYGYKPAFGEVHTEMPFSHYSGTGPMARTFADLVLMENIISGPTKYSLNVHPTKKLPLSYPSIQGMKIAYVGGLGIANPSREVQEAMEQAIDLLKKQGAVIDKIDLNLGLSDEELNELFRKMALGGPMGGMLQHYTDQTDNMTSYAAHFVKLAARGEYGSKQSQEAETRAKLMYKMIVDETFAKGYDVIIAPTLVTPNIPADYDFTKDKIKIDGTQYHPQLGVLMTMPFNILNWMPVINVPVALSKQGIPIGMQIIGRAQDTRTVFKVAFNYSKSGPKFFTGELLPKIYS
ncbi:amidase [Legionella londiniensis]|uniref:amidase n=1 Tax=Legionella londiniensis TaxID=45068 RepID=UPI00399D53A1